MAITVLYGSNKFSFYGTNMSAVASIIDYTKGKFGDVFSGAVHRIRITAYGVAGRENMGVTNLARIRTNYLFPNRNGRIMFSSR